ncbi:hypothetical protein RZS08_67255, partial [Arthrospira platensis SPKY1]|nr:hypothetical protein [Arthrospira platensis SPKY1]
GAGEAAERLAGLAAADAVREMQGGAEALPDLEKPAFPGPIAEAFYWSDDGVVGIQGPVGSGKTTTLLKSRLRRALMMPRSTVDGVRRYKLLTMRETYRQLWST